MKNSITTTNDIDKQIGLLDQTRKNLERTKKLLDELNKLKKQEATLENQIRATLGGQTIANGSATERLPRGVITMALFEHLASYGKTGAHVSEIIERVEKDPKFQGVANLPQRVRNNLSTSDRFEHMSGKRGWFRVKGKQLDSALFNRLNSQTEGSTSDKQMAGTN